MKKTPEVLVIDGQGGGLGRQVIQALRKEFPELKLRAAGTNGTAADAMRKAGADRAASGENAVLVACRKADVIIGPIGIVIADSMFGEITPAMALAAAQADAKRILIPVNHCDNIVAGVSNNSTGALIGSVVEKLGAILQEEE
ncbi:MAG: DUF3842 family protein [Stomatobaculum sp.]|nr:DUF3842 family protein [Stomatobaculum sp.]